METGEIIRNPVIKGESLVLIDLTDKRTLKDILIHKDFQHLLWFHVDEQTSSKHTAIWISNRYPRIYTSSNGSNTGPSIWICQYLED